ncbi:MAG: glycogen-debranching protein [Cyanobacteria bacterium SZAS LIN-5]|nr:glycogen-debranching protein [Cyanobacteria bacterium SZAS LIN-5]
MVGDRLDITAANKPAEAASSTQHDSSSWFASNVLDPFIHGTGVVQVYNTFADKKDQIALPETHQAKMFSVDWAVQSLSGAAGAIIPYVVAGKVMGSGMRALGGELGLQGGAARFMANESAAQILGAGAYDFVKAPNQGETRIGNAVGTMAGFAVFEGGNHFISKAVPTAATTQIARLGLTGAGRFGVGAVGGLTSYDAANLTTSLVTGRENQSNMEGRLNAMANGGFINVALPAVQKGFTKAADFAINGRSFGGGIPVERYLQNNGISDPELSKLSYENRLARVKELTGKDSGTGSVADTRNNVVVLDASQDIGKLAHELTHLRLANQYEGGYRTVAKNLKSDPVKAEQQFMQIRAEMESQARQAEVRVQTRKTGAAPDVVTDVAKIGQEVAVNGKTYNDIWKSEFARFQADPTYRPAKEYSGAPESGNADAKATKPGENQAGENNPGDNKPGQVVPIDKATFGSPEHFGATITEKGVNFAVDSHGAKAMDLLIFDSADAREPSQVLPMYETNGVWHREVPGMKAGDFYLFKAHGDYTPAQDGSRFNSQKALLDPYGKAVTGDVHPTGKGEELGYDNTVPNDASRQLRPSTVDNTAVMPKNVVVDTKDFKWDGDKPLETPMSDTIIYEMNLRGFTADDASIAPQLRGTYRGMIEKIPYLKDLGITAVELMPIMKFHAEDSTRTNPQTGEKLQNAWGYNTMSFQAPEGRFAADGTHGQQVNEFKSLVKALHDNNIEVIMDVVFNHTAEGDPFGPTFSFKGLDNNQYYLLVPNRPELYFDATGCGNTVNANNPKVQKFILDTLKYWHEDYHIDGFRFDLATAFNFDATGKFQEKTPIMQAIENEPAFAKVKFIAEPWDIMNYRLGHFSDRMWSEWNGSFRDVTRGFVRGESGQTGVLADRIAGSPGWFDESTGRHSINFATAHDGFTLRDLVSYDSKHNEANGEQNRDGSNDNKSWNSGYEGPVEHANIPEWQKIQIEQLRDRQMKNMLSLLYLSRGTPMMLMGDEIRRTQNGNNNAYNQLRLNNMPWSQLPQNADMLRFTQMMIDLRKSHEIGRTQPSDISWHGVEPFKPDFSEGARFIAWQTTPKAPGVKPLYQAFNAYWEPIKIQLPPGEWSRLVDTNLPTGQDIVTSDKATPLAHEYIIQPRSGIVLEGK